MKTYRYMIGMLLCVWLLAACDNSNAFDEYAKFDTTAQTAWGQSIVDGSNGYVAHVKSDRTYNLADGVDVLEMAFLADDGLAMQLFLFKIALSDKITLRTTLADDKNQVGTGQTIMKQLEAMQKNGKKVLGRHERRLLQYDDLHPLRRMLPRRRGGEDFVQPYGLQRLRDHEGQRGLLASRRRSTLFTRTSSAKQSAAAARCCSRTASSWTRAATRCRWRRWNRVRRSACRRMARRST